MRELLDNEIELVSGGRMVCQTYCYFVCLPSGLCELVCYQTCSPQPDTHPASASLF